MKIITEAPRAVPHVVTLRRSAVTVTIKAADRDVAVVEARKRGFDAVSAAPVHGD